MRDDRREEGRGREFRGREERGREGRGREGRGREERGGEERGREDRGRGEQFGGERRREDWGRAREQSRAPTELQRVRDSDLDCVYGVAPVLAALRAARRVSRTLYVQERGEGGGGGGAGPARKASHEAALREVHYLAETLGVPVRGLPKGDLNVLSRDRPHQGLVLHATGLEYEDVADVGPPAGGDVWLVLDEVSDPQNLGALLRSAHFLGAKGVVACRRNSAALTPVVSKASAGALEAMSVRGVASMPRFLRRAKEQGWRIVGAAMTEEAVGVGELPLGDPTLVVLGSEGRGLRPMVREACDALVRIGPADAADGAVDSLNVSVAGAIVLHKLLGD